MNEPAPRPDPDALLERLKVAEAREGQGKLRVFFGFAPGVGKTYRMLQVARELALEKGVDVVIGVVETHRREETAALVEGLAAIPPRIAAHRGRPLTELDLDAVLARRPAVVLVDELAHTNAPGSRHAKRWQDVLEIVEAGIDVMTTVNVQHVESLNDVVQRITHVQVRETIPDAILDRADAIEVVDIAPEELLARLEAGKIYLRDQAARAAQHFFRLGNLLSLRELALRRTAQHVDADVMEYRAEHGVASTWAAGERILVAVGPAPSSANLIRAASRMAAGLKAPWTAAYVETSLGGPTDRDRQRLEAHLRLAESLGGSVTRLPLGRVSRVLLDHARRNNVTRIVIGKPTHSRLRDRLRGSLLDEVVRGSGDIEVHVTRGEIDAPLREERASVRRPASRAPFAPAPFLWAAGIVLAVTCVAAFVRWVFPVPDLEVLYLVGVMVTAIRFGRGPALVSAALGIAAYDFFFVPPYLTLAVADARHFLTFAMMFGVGFVVSELTIRIRRQETEAIAREERTAALYALSRDLGPAADEAEIAAVGARHASDVFDATAYVFRPDGSGALRVAGSAPEAEALPVKEVAVVKWAFENGRLAGLGTDTLPAASIVCAPLGEGKAAVGVLALAPRDGAPLGAEQRAFVDAFGRQIAFAFERARLAGEARASALRARAEEMRSSLLSAVSHDLRTPLASITGAATTIRDGAGLPEATRDELIDSICDEAERLERLVGNLLDMTRLDSGELVLKREWIPLDEIVGSALTRLEARLGARAVHVDIARDVPLVSVDPVLFAQIFVNLFENAAKYTPPDSPIDVVARVERGAVTIDVLDRGPGLPEGAEEKVFEKFFRASPQIPGVGLGLSICRGIAEAHGGSMHAARRSGGGARFRVTLPIVGDPPRLDDEPPPISGERPQGGDT